MATRSMAPIRYLLLLLLALTVGSVVGPAVAREEGDGNSCAWTWCRRYYDVNGTHVKITGVKVPFHGEVVEVGELDITPDLLVTPNENLLLLDQAQYGLCHSANAVRRDPDSCLTAQTDYRTAVYNFAIGLTGKEIQSWFEDADGDGYGNASVSKNAFSAPNGYVADPRDCLDSSINIHPGASEVCNAIDDDCTGKADDSAVDAQYWYQDADGDGAGSGCTRVSACSAPSGYVANANDPDDSSAATTSYAAGAIIFEDRGFGGRQELFAPGEYSDLRSSSLHDLATSLRVPSGYEVYVCEDTNFQGRCKAFRSDQDMLDECCTVVRNDTISSIRVTRLCPAK